MTELFKNLSKNQADVYVLVLSSSDITHHVKKVGRKWSIWINDKNRERALSTIEQYLEENQNFHSTDEPLYYKSHKTFTGLWASFVLLVCYVAITMSNNSHAFITVYGSSSFHILQGELYRTVTSLMLHADILHLAGNILGIALFGTLVCSITGWGVGWLMILTTGIAGNLANAALYKTGHLSIGASTAVFGAIGILAGQQFFKKLRLPGQRTRAWLPLGGGIALLGILGSGENVDIMAHLFGFMAGIITGSLYTIFVKQPKASVCQACCLLITLSILVISWIKPLIP